MMKESTIERFQVDTALNSWGNVETYYTNLGTFNICQVYNDYYGNPRVAIQPVGYIKELPKLEGFRRNNHMMQYTAQSYDYSQTMDWFLWKLSAALDKGHQLYVNKDINHK